MEGWGKLSHLYVTVLLAYIPVYLVYPTTSDVIVGAVCSGGVDGCSLAIYLAGGQQAITGVGAVVMLPLIGKLSDAYGRKNLLTLPLTLQIIPLLIMAWNRSTNFFYVYFTIRTFTDMIVTGGVVCLCLGYLYFLKARFGFDKDQFSVVFLISNAGSDLTYVVLMPLSGPFIGEETLIKFWALHWILKFETNAGRDEHDLHGYSTIEYVVEHVPECDDKYKLYIGRKFSTVKDAEDFYRSCGAACGFDVRLGQLKKSCDGNTVLSRYIYCNREGVKASYNNLKSEGSPSYKRRRRLTTRVSCEAKVKLKFCGRDGYVVDFFKEWHTHSLVLESYRHFLKVNKNLDDVQQNFILNCAKSNIGPIKSFRLFKEIVGSYRNVGCSSVEFKNFSRDLKAYVEGVDAQILLDKFRMKKEIFPDFTYHYSVNEHNKLTRIFWADTTSIKMYRAFGEAVSFDATYETNKYNMVFTPFTGKDNHGKCVTFGAGLLTSEDADSYKWILKKFVECMKIAPRMIITDQDPALKIAVKCAMPNTNHRFCMWHIMKKVAIKIPISLRENEGFSQKFNDIVWSETIEPFDFEMEWNELLEEYDLAKHEWFATMFELREFWILAFFKDVPMAGLFRTTSMSECENSFFQKYSHRNANLLTFLMHFECAIDAQRDQHDKLSSTDQCSLPKMRNECLFEKHAASVYTTQIFQNKVQKEIRWSTLECSILNLIHGQTVTTYDIKDSWLNKVFKVEVNISEETYDCECKHFFKYGLLCRHVFVVFKNNLIRTIPEKYIVSQWTRYACSEDLLPDVERTNEGQIQMLYFLNMLHQSAKKCIGMVGRDVVKMKELLEDFNDLAAKYNNDGGKDTATSSKHIGFQSFYDSSIPKNIDVLPPDPIKTKGSGSDMKSRRDKAIRDANKPKRKCGTCKQMTNHDARNCPFKV